MPCTRSFLVDGRPVALAALQEANKDDPGLLAWARSAEPGDVFAALVDCRCITPQQAAAIDDADARLREAGLPDYASLLAVREAAARYVRHLDGVGIPTEDERLVDALIDALEACDGPAADVQREAGDAAPRRREGSGIREVVQGPATRLPGFTYARHAANGYEVSSHGDRRFSALEARLSDGRTVEMHYQCDVKGYDPGGTDWRLGKGKPPLDQQPRDLWDAYLRLWQRWAAEHPDLIEDLRAKAVGRVLTDRFATSPICQARALAYILNTTPASGARRAS